MLNFVCEFSCTNGFRRKCPIGGHLWLDTEFNSLTCLLFMLPISDNGCRLPYLFKKISNIANLVIWAHVFVMFHDGGTNGVRIISRNAFRTSILSRSATILCLTAYFQNRQNCLTPMYRRIFVWHFVQFELTGTRFTSKKSVWSSFTSSASPCDTAFHSASWLMELKSGNSHNLKTQYFLIF